MNRSGKALSGVALLLSLMISVPAMAAPDTLYTNITADQLGQIMERNGWVVDASWGGITWYIDDTYASIFMYDDGNAIQFYKYITGVRYSLWEINQWNRDHRYSRSYLDMDGDPVIELDLDLSGGVTEARIIEWLKTCHVSLIWWYWTITAVG